MIVTEIKRIAAVLRVSTASQRHDERADSVDKQREGAEAWAASMGWQLVKVYDETAERGFQSGRAKINDRPYVMEMFSDAEAGLFDALTKRDEEILRRLAE